MSRKRRDALIEELTDAFRAYQTATDQLDELAQRLMGVNRTDARCLDILDRGGRMTAGRLAEESGLTTGAVTAVIDRLERAGLARRVRDESDRRRVLVEHTDHAARLGEEIYAGIGIDGRKLLAGYTDEQLALFVELMRGAHGITVEHAARLRERAERDADRGGTRRARRLPA